MITPATATSTAEVNPLSGCSVVLCDSLEKVYGLDQPRPHALGRMLLPRRGVGSFQVAVLPFAEWSPGHHGEAVPSVASSHGLTVTPHAVDFMPCQLTASAQHDERYEQVGPSLLPDVLRPLSPGEGLPLTQNQWRSLWLTIRSGDVTGDHTVTVELTAQYTGEPIASVAVPVTVLDAELPESPIICTQWFHVDGLAHYYGTDPYSSFGWQLIERFVTSMIASGSTSVLTPIHTPPLDTAVGGRRLDVALVGVLRTNAGYEFDMRNLENWLSMCKRTGVRELEMAHLFTQWGGLHAPNIDDAEGRNLFGWQTDSLGVEYQQFLRAYIPAVRRVLDEHWQGPVFWHLTDEPSREHAPRYQQLQESVAPLLHGCVMTDALSDTRLWSSGLVDPPIVATDHAQAFLELGLENPWLYYCTVQSVDVSNRFIAMPSYRNRVLGWQLFAHEASGFLHWGFNFWNTQLSRRPVDPFRDPTAGGGFQAGDAFIVYPGPGGEPWESIRFRVFREAMDDLRLFTALAERDGRAAVTTLLGLDSLTLDDYPSDPAHYLAGHAEALEALAQHRRQGDGTRDTRGTDQFG